MVDRVVSMLCLLPPDYEAGLRGALAPAGQGLYAIRSQPGTPA